MNIRTRRCLSVLAVAAVLATYGAGAWRIEVMRQTPKALACGFGHCLPTDSSFSALSRR